MTQPFSVTLVREKTPQPSGPLYDIYIEGNKYSDLVQLGQTFDEGGANDLYYKGKRSFLVNIS